MGKISAITIGFLVLFVTEVTHSRECSMSPSAEGCTLFSRCRQPADVHVSCGSVSGLIDSKEVIPEFIKVTIMTSSDSKIDSNGRFIPGVLRDYKPLVVKFKNTKNYTVEDLYFKQAEINQELAQAGFPPSTLKNDNFSIQMKLKDPIYSDSRKQNQASERPSAAPVKSNGSDPLAGYMFCNWASEPNIEVKKCGKSDGVCSGEIRCEGNGKFAGAPPPRNFTVTCETVGGRCPDALSCARSPEPQGGSSLRRRCGGGTARSASDDVSSASSNRAQGVK